MCGGGGQAPPPPTPTPPIPPAQVPVSLVQEGPPGTPLAASNRSAAAGTVPGGGLGDTTKAPTSKTLLGA